MENPLIALTLFLLICLLPFQTPAKSTGSTDTEPCTSCESLAGLKINDVNPLSDAEPFKASRLQSPITLDGQVEEPAWMTLEPLPVTQQTPNNSKEPTERTELRMAYDEDYLYFSGKMFTRDPSLIEGGPKKRDFLGASSDWFFVMIDSYNDKENGLSFGTTPSGLRSDYTISNDAQGAPGQVFNMNWNTFWEVATSITEEGWFAEMRIPFSSLRFQDKNGQVVMGITIWRWNANPFEIDAFPHVPDRWGILSVWKPSQGREIRFEGVKSKKPLYLSPYVLSGIQETAQMNEAQTQFQQDRDPQIEAGLDLKYNLTNNLIGDLTINTDFAQVEADDQQVNLTRFSLFFPEKRQFFQERSSLFEFCFDDFNRLFHSRRIGLHDKKPVRIYGGARLAGRIGDNDVGFLNMQTEAAGDLNSENFNLFRVRRRVLNENSYAGAILTTRMDFKGDFNTVYGFDGLFRLTGDEYLSVKWAQSFQDGAPNRLFSLDPARLYFNWERRRLNGFHYNFTFSSAGKSYEPAMGFELREHFSSLNNQFAYGWTMGEQSKLMRVSTQLNSFALRNNGLGKLETGRLQAMVNILTKKFMSLNVLLNFHYEDLPESFLLGDAQISPAAYRFFNVTGNFQTPGTRSLRASILFMAGQFYDGHIFSLGWKPDWRISSSLELSGFYEYTRASFPRPEDGLFTAHLGRIRILYMLNTRFSIGAFLQYSSDDEKFSSNIRIRYNPREGNDLYIVYNDLVNSRRGRDFPVLPLHDTRAIVLKYTHTFCL